MPLIQIIVLAVIQGAAELLPVSSSAHVIVAEKLMGLDPSAPEMTFLLVMLHTGTMFAVLAYFWRRWAKLISKEFISGILIATLTTGVVGFGLKKVIEKVFMSGGSKAEIETLFSNLPLISLALLSAGLLILFAGTRKSAPDGLSSPGSTSLTSQSSATIGMVQGLCLPFRGFSRSGATISTAMLLKIPRVFAEDFSFALAVVLTPPVILLELRRLMKAKAETGQPLDISTVIMPGMLGMVFSFIAGLFALKILSSWLENGKWKFFGYYCIVAAIGVFTLSAFGF